MALPHAYLALVDADGQLVDLLSAAPAGDTGQVAVPVRVISQLGAGTGGGGVSQQGARDATAQPWYVGADVADSAVDAGNPVKVGGVVRAAPRAGLAVGDRAELLLTGSGLLGVALIDNASGNTVQIGSDGRAATKIVSTDSFDAANVVNVNPGPTEWGLVVRNIPGGTQTVSGLVDVSDRAARAVGAVSPAAGSLWDVSDRAARLLGVVSDKSAASSAPIGSVSLGNSTGKTLRSVAGSLTTTAVTADQVIATYTVTAGTTFYLAAVAWVVRLTTLSATASVLGTISLEMPSGTKRITLTKTNPTTSFIVPDVLPFSEPLPLAAASVIRCVCTPAATTSMLWNASIVGYEK